VSASANLQAGLFADSAIEAAPAFSGSSDSPGRFKIFLMVARMRRMGMGAGGLTSIEQTALRDLAWHWEDAYERFTVTDGVWQASPVGEPGRVITAESAQELREKIRADYGEHNVSLATVRGERMST
jgi:hypothetical protein